MFRHHRQMRRYTAFNVPIILSVHIALGACYKPVSLIVPVTLYGLSYRIFLLNHTNYLCRYIHISMYPEFRPVHSQVRQFLFGAFSPLLFYRPPAYRQHIPPLEYFPQLCLFGLLSADFTELLNICLLSRANRSIKGSVSGRYSFIPLTRIISSPNI